MNSPVAMAFLAHRRRKAMVRKVVTALVIAGSFALSACNTVRGAAEDVESVANCTEEMMNRGEC
jgi:predicted small secreted protein